MGWPTIYFDLFGMRGRGRGGPQRWDWRRCADRALPFFGYGFLTSFRQRIIADHIKSLPKTGYGFVTTFWQHTAVYMLPYEGILYYLPKTGYDFVTRNWLRIRNQFSARNS